MSKELRELIAKSATLDGGFGTELETRGVNVNTALWSLTVILSQPEEVLALHRDYYLAGADIGTTCSYQASLDLLEEYGQDHDGLYSTKEKRAAFYEKCVEVIRIGKAEAQSTLGDKRLFIAASIGPYGALLCDGAEFSGYYRETDEKYKEFHRERLEFFANHKEVDCLAVETVPVFGEIKALILLLEENDKPYYLSLSIKDPQHLADGTPIEEVVAYLKSQGVFEAGKMLALGANCLKLRFLEEYLEHLQRHVPQGFPLILYPNSGEIYDGVNKTWAPDPECRDLRFSWERIVPLWIKNGAKIVGGCCRVGVKDIELIDKARRSAM